MKKIREGKLFWTIGEVAALHDVPPHTIRFWCMEFECEPKKKSVRGVRYFDMGEVMKLQEIYDLLKVELYTIEGARRQLLFKNKNEI